MDIEVMLTALSGVFVILGCLVSNSVMGMNDNYISLSRYLMTIRNPNKDERIYLEAAKGLLPAIERNPKAFQEGYRKCVEDFIKLEMVLDGPQCTFEEYEIMYAVTSQADGHKQTSRPDEQAPVRKVVYEVSLLRAKACRKQWPGKFKDAYLAMSPTVKDYAEFSDWNRLRQVGDTNRDFMQHLTRYRYEGLDGSIITIANSHIMRRSHNHEDKCYYTGMILTYLLKPCIEYRTLLWDPILLQARYDAQMFVFYSGFLFGPDRNDNPMMQFYLSMAHSELCLVVDDEIFVGMLYSDWWDIQEAQNTECFESLSNTFDIGRRDHPDYK